jgi:acetamidase/formamidase
VPPWFHAGNIDNKEFVAGTTLFIPVHAPGALFQVGDGHAGQGNGEVDITALETSLTGVFQFVVRKDLHLRWRRGETPTHYITMGMHEDLREAARLAVEQMIDVVSVGDVAHASACRGELQFAVLASESSLTAGLLRR